MFRYSGYYSLILDSEIPLPQLPEATGEPDVTIRLGKVPRVSRLAGMTDEVALHRLAGAFHIRHGREIVVDPLPEVEPDALRTILLGRMMAYLLRQRGWLALHASGVTIDGVGVLFLGISRSGKSTTAAAFYSRGHPVITDDVAAVRVSGAECLVLPCQRLRLDGSSLSIVNGRGPRGVREWDKYAFNAGADHPLPPSTRIQRIYVLAERRAVSLQPLSHLASVRFLSAHSFFERRRMELPAIENHLSNCAAVATTTPATKLFRPRDLSVLPDLVRTVERDVTAR